MEEELAEKTPRLVSSILDQLEYGVNILKIRFQYFQFIQRNPINIFKNHNMGMLVFSIPLKGILSLKIDSHNPLDPKPDFSQVH